MDLLTRLAGFAVAMLVLSLIVEKLTNLWKLHGPPALQPTSSLPGPSSPAEMRRIATVNTATFVAGIVVALLLKADALQIMSSSHPDETIGWQLVFMDPAAFDSLTRYADSLDSMSLRAEGFSVPTVRHAQRLRLLDEGSTARILLRVSSVAFLALAFSLLLLSLVTRYHTLIRTPKPLKPSTPAVVETLKQGTDKVLRFSYRHTLPLSLLCFVLSAGFILGAGDAAEPDEWRYLFAYAGLFIGVILSGAAISFGSKFWHDLLGLLFAVRRYREALASPDTYRDPEGALRRSGSGETVQGPSRADLERYVAENEQELLRRSGVVGFGIGLKQREGRRTTLRSVILYVEQKRAEDELTTAERIPKAVTWRAPDGRRVTIPFDVVVTGLFEATLTCRKEAARLPDDATPPQPGCSVSNVTREDSGTIGCLVSDKYGTYLLSNWHVLRPPRDRDTFDVMSPSAEDYGDPARDTIGRIVKHDPELDIAIAEVKVRVRPDVVDIGGPEGQRHLDKADLAGYPIKEIWVQLWGRTSARQLGTVTGVGEVITARVDGERRTFRNVILTTRILCPGDSGALLMDMDRNAVGLAVCTSEHRSAFLPIGTVLTRLRVELVTT